MKQLTLLATIVVFFLLTTQAVSAQAPMHEAAIKKATAELQTTYSLNEGQTQKVRQIQQWKYEDLQELEALKTNQPELYLRKRQSVFQQTQERVRRVLTDEQQVAFDANLQQQKQEKEALLKQKQAAGADKMEIQSLLLELEDY